MRLAIFKVAVAVLLLVFVGDLFAFQPSPDAQAGACGTACASCGGFVFVVIFLIVALIVLHIALLVWVARDAKSRGMDGAVIWMALVMFIGLIGLLIYLFSRPQGNSAPVRPLPQQAAASQRQVPTLRQRLRRLPRWQVVAGLAIVGAGILFVDSCRAPENQVSAGLYLWCVSEYQSLARPVLQGRVQCRFVPTCSEYSRQAVARYGIRKGLTMTVDRICRCREDVPLGTPDLP